MIEKDIDRILLETLKLTRENNEMLQRISSRQKWSRTWAALRWIVIIAAILIGVYFAYPYLKDIRAEFVTVMGQVSALSSLGK